MVSATSITLNYRSSLNMDRLISTLFREEPNLFEPPTEIAPDSLRSEPNAG